jgi:hypothetical protein
MSDHDDSRPKDTILSLERRKVCTSLGWERDAESGLSGIVCEEIVHRYTLNAVMHFESYSKYFRSSVIASLKSITEDGARHLAVKY